MDVKERGFAAAVVVSIGIVIAGAFIGWGFLRGRQADRFVTVKGVSEREVRADLALWPIRLVVTDDNLGAAQDQLARSTASVFSFLARHGVDTAQVELQDLSVTDQLANRYGERGAGPRYIVNQTVMVRSSEPDVVFAASQSMGELVAADVPITSGLEFGPGGPVFLFNGLNELKPAMIAEATASAREAAEQFAADARARLGGIRQANQGVFVILPRDQVPGIREEQQIVKIVRVVATLEYLLDR
ncbi:MAG: SIMPL domain-containing protein [Gemmatimonadetes bacterium]|nr:SIMPL domain-containing protein [Gemmatimonadota bacterium]